MRKFLPHRWLDFLLSARFLMMIDLSLGHRPVFATRPSHPAHHFHSYFWSRRCPPFWLTRLRWRLKTRTRIQSSCQRVVRGSKPKKKERNELLNYLRVVVVSTWVSEKCSGSTTSCPSRSRSLLNLETPKPNTVSSNSWSSMTIFRAEPQSRITILSTTRNNNMGHWNTQSCLSRLLVGVELFESLHLWFPPSKRTSKSLSEPC